MPVITHSCGHSRNVPYEVTALDLAFEREQLCPDCESIAIEAAADAAWERNWLGITGELAAEYAKICEQIKAEVSPDDVISFYGPAAIAVREEVRAAKEQQETCCGYGKRTFEVEGHAYVVYFDYGH